MLHDGARCDVVNLPNLKLGNSRASSVINMMSLRLRPFSKMKELLTGARFGNKQVIIITGEQSIRSLEHSAAMDAIRHLGED